MHPVDRQGALESAHGGRHAPQRRPGEVALGALDGRGGIVEKSCDQLLHAEREPQSVAPWLAVRAVHARDARRDVALVVDVLHALGRSRGEYRIAEFLEHRQGRVQERVTDGGCVVGVRARGFGRPPGAERGTEGATRIGRQLQMSLDSSQEIACGEGVLLGQQFVQAHQ